MSTDPFVDKDLALTYQERQLIEILRTLIPFEEVRIVKDRGGRAEDFFVTRTRKVVITQKETVAQR